MRLKKLLIAVMVICILVVPQSAFAALGFGDTQATAIPLTPNSNAFEFFLTSNLDEDWYKWENNTGNYKMFYASMTMPNLSYYKFHFKIKFPNGDETELIESVPSGSDSLYRYFPYLLVPEGATLYLKVSGSVNPNDRFYRMFFNYY